MAKGAPKKTTKGYNVTAIQQWRIENVKTQPKDESEFSVRMAMARLRKEEALAEEAEWKAKKIELELRKQAANLVDLDAVDQFFTQLIAGGRRQLLRIPEEIAAGFPEDQRVEVRDLIAKHLEMWLRSMNAKSKNLAGIREL
ncbi:hypothetical protein [Aporhodopirellula aestuarii]|uniref:Host attachment protein n=1 Tax=Aporhodopirellula aestuarii TaxID=2950107 RepID=A0ABT0U231_9BACT|nr:hypothetical protein [Aporhodopirellula aestuarii]MCM2370955.1 hypothetical protein [Aporhodopirellula aestuarii]